ncbi:hypothetical protein G7Y89_g15520 [Cudoniella acicularis]|uniref:Uncharacterized protein n=1 Tax=Cudoniella acicularis TaxID=354080 RepID=A0A8H4QM54_9HELO|nr:hypothetical protein G7Y89_g15520 [Cudoniella acicularis]
MLVTALYCYSALIASLPIVTPIVELLGRNITASIWENARDTPPPRRTTLFPFEKDLLLGREVAEAPEQPDLVEGIGGEEYKVNDKVDGKGKGKGDEKIISEKVVVELIDV